MSKTIKIHLVLRRLLQERGLTTSQLSKQVGLPNSTIATWLQADCKPTDVSKIAVVAEYFGIGMHRLLFDQEETATPLTGIQTEIVLDGFYRLRLEKVLLPKK